MARTLFDKIWDSHVIKDLGNGFVLLHIDRLLLHDLSGARALQESVEKGYRPAEPRLMFATPDHAISTAPGRTERTFPPGEPLIRNMRAATAQFGIKLFDLGQDGNGIVHVVGPELGLTLPGTTLCCGDSHTCTHGGMGSLAFGIGSSELSHVLATQTMVQRRPRRMRVRFDGTLSAGVTAKDMILHLIGELGTAAGTGYAVEYAGSAVRSLPVEARLTLCNLT
ncbi:MAG: 3-isopropylmalate dehydratase, partial [Alphaproteobacteria bacterium]|nr:3-isopropylmalate dehydratase [Alphaproteobacteria bacterium]